MFSFGLEGKPHLDVGYSSEIPDINGCPFLHARKQHCCPLQGRKTRASSDLWLQLSFA
jgi:hypothetical protein